MEFYLSSKSLKNINDSGFDKDFEIFIFDEQIQCSKFVASFLSSKISTLLHSDFTIDHFYADIPTESIYYKSHEELKTKLSRTNFIHKLKLLLNGESIHIEDNEKDEISELLFEFGYIFDNQDMIDIGLQRRASHLTDQKEINQENIQEFLEISRLLKNEEYKKKSLDFIARNFYCIFDKMSFDKMKKSELDYILSSKELRIESEDNLFDTIVSQSNEYFFLFDYINVEYLSNEKMQELIDLIDNYEVSLHSRLWSSICRRLVLEGIKPKNDENPRIIKDKNKKTKGKVIDCSQGIFESMRNESQGKNIYESKIIDIETSYIFDGDIKNIFDKSKNTHVRLANQQNGFILLDFKDKKINFSKYYFSVPNSNCNGRPKSWLIEGSNDKQTWDNIDKKENDSSLNDFGRSNTFTCKNITDKFYRFIRIKNIISHDGSSESYYFLISELEFYGKIEKQ